MKKLFTYILVIFFITAVAIVLFLNKTSILSLINKQEEKDSLILESNEKTLDEEVETMEEKKKRIAKIAQERIATLRKRFSYKGLIISGDLHTKNNEYKEALENYLEVLKGTKEDEKILKKIGDTYFNMSDYENAYLYYSKIKTYSLLDKDHSILTLLYGNEIKKENIEYIYGEIDSFDLGEEKTFYYKNSISCLEDFHECKVELNEYFDSNEPTIKELIDIKEAIISYRNFQMEELYYKNALIIGALYKNKNYNIAVNLGIKLLKDRYGYKPILLILAKSYYELGEYNNAKKYLASYYEQAQDDKAAVYLLGVIKMKLDDNLISNVFLNKALDLGYTPVIDIKRKIVYNFYKLGETQKMLSTLRDIVKDKEVPKEGDDVVEVDNLTLEDISLAIYYHIINDEMEYAKDLIKESIEKYPEEDLFYSYDGWVLKEEGNLEQARTVIKKALSLDEKNPMSNFNMGLIELENKNITLAKLYFKKILRGNNTSEYSLMATEELEKIKENEK